MKVFVLINAGEGSTEAVFVMHGTKEDLINQVQKKYSNDIEKMSYGESNKKFAVECSGALIAMLYKHENWENGKHTVLPIEPHWGDWSLIIADKEYAFIS